MNKVKLFSVYTDETKALKDIFFSSIHDDWELNIHYWGKIGVGEGNPWSPGWYDILRKKIEFLADEIKKNYGQIIIWSDIDIQFFGRCSDYIDQNVMNNDLLFLSEHWPEKEINSGFIVIRCNAKTLSFFESVLRTRLEELRFGDQTAINALLNGNTLGLRWDILPRQFWARSHGAEPPIDVILHHANFTIPHRRGGKTIASIQLKIEQLDHVKKHVLFYRRWPWLFHIRRALKVCKRNLGNVQVSNIIKRKNTS